MWGFSLGRGVLTVRNYRLKFTALYSRYLIFLTDLTPASCHFIYLFIFPFFKKNICFFLLQFPYVLTFHSVQHGIFVSHFKVILYLIIYIWHRNRLVITITKLLLHNFDSLVFFFPPLTTCYSCIGHPVRQGHLKQFLKKYHFPHITFLFTVSPA